MSGIFVTFEGIEGCGKSTQLAMLGKWLRENGHDVVETREPGGTILGEGIRKILQTKAGCDAISFSPRAEILLFEASRAQHVDEKIAPAIGAGKIVLCDRFCDSTVVYQGFARAIDFETVLFLNEFASNGHTPDMTIFQSIEVTESFRRIAMRSNARDRIEQESGNFFEKVRAGYMRLAAENARFFTVDGMDDVEIIHGKIKNEFRNRFFKN
ncbi:MAG: dTMP kinase [Puniceicoccales bacterium]|jgi:dTMP kinase|nr:dTMP kinase [Puniceicoccales bacterium]